MRVSSVTRGNPSGVRARAQPAKGGVTPSAGARRAPRIDHVNRISLGAMAVYVSSRGGPGFRLAADTVAEEGRRVSW